MYIWEVLGIEATTDVVAIKKAFAQKAKQYHPEEYPEEYKKLRNAYKKAIALAKQQTQVQNTPETAGESVRAPENTQQTKKKENREEPFHFEDIFRKDQIIEVPPVEKPKLDTNRIERPNIEPPKLEAPKLDIPIIEKSGQTNGKRNIQDNRNQRENLQILKERKERKKPEVPSLRELLNQSPSFGPPVIEDPLRVYPQEKKKRKPQFKEISKELDFSFEEVEKAYSPEEVEDFFYFFRAIANHPILRDNVEIWTLYLEQPELKDFFRREENCQRMIQIIEKYFWGKRDIYLYFEFFLQVKTGKKMEEFQSFNWKFKKWWGALPWGKEMRSMTAEETELHNYILEELHKKNIYYDLIHYEAARIAYLEFYFAELKDNRGAWKQRWMQGHKYRMEKGRKKIIVTMILPIALLLLILAMGSLSYNIGVKKTNAKIEKEKTVIEQEQHQNK